MENSCFPDDLLLQILVRLPPKSLLRFKCVSKSWHILISSQDFSKMHLNRSLIYPEPLRLLCEEKRFEITHRMPIFAADFSKLESFPDTIQPLHHPLKVTELMKSTIIGSCNGLLCSNLVFYKDYFDNEYRYDESFLIFNPLTRKCQWISGETSWDQDGRSNFYGFGYDDVHDDYKVVTWDVRPNPSEIYPPEYSKFEVYSVRNGSWSTTNSALNSSYMDRISSGVLVNCVLHWMWKNWTDPGNCKYDIVAFDLRTEEHWLMETPTSDLAIPAIDSMDEYYCRMDLGVLNGCLCGIVYDGENPNKLDLWVMKVYGVKDSWIKMTIDMSSQVQITGELYTKLVTPIVPIEHVEKKEQMMLYSYEEGFLLCDMVINKLSNVIKIPEFGPKWRGEFNKFISEFSFVPKEFCFQGSLVELPGFRSFYSFDKKRRRMQDPTSNQRKKRRRPLSRTYSFKSAKCSKAEDCKLEIKFDTGSLCW